METCSFRQDDLRTVGEALGIAEDATGNFFKFSSGQWMRHRFQVGTLGLWGRDRVVENAFAVLNREKRTAGEYGPPSRVRDLYYIWLQDPLILEALQRDPQLHLLPLMLYVFTHELIHIVRFCGFSQRFDAPEKDKEKEERIVHRMTYEILGRLSLPRLDHVLESYRGQRVCRLAV